MFWTRSLGFVLPRWSAAKGSKGWLASVLCLVGSLLVACGSSGAGTPGIEDGGSDGAVADAVGDALPTDGASDAGLADAANDSGPTHTNTHDCPVTCGAGQYCAYALGPGTCPPADSGICPDGCLGCPPLPGASCTALPAACNGTPTCDCLLTTCPQCGPGSMCSIDADGNWVVDCISC